MKHDNIPTPTVRRLSLYLRQLESFLEEDKRTISSKQLGEALRLTDAQVRKDLAYFGQFGFPGIGYRVDDLIVKVRQILGTDKICNVCVVGIGHLGTALVAYKGFVKKGFQLVAAFDSDPQKIGRPMPAMPSISIEGFDQLRSRVQERAIRIGILTVPAEAAQAVANQLIEAGIGGILNFAPISLSVAPDFPIANVDLAVHLEQLSFLMGVIEHDKGADPS